MSEKLVEEVLDACKDLGLQADMEEAQVKNKYLSAWHKRMSLLGILGALDVEEILEILEKRHPENADIIAEYMKTYDIIRKRAFEVMEKEKAENETPLKKE